MALALELLNQYEQHISAVSLLEQVVLPESSGLITPSLFSGLHCASFFGIVELVTVLINDGAYQVDQQDCTGSTPLTWAAGNGHEGVVKLLLEREDVDPNLPNRDGDTPLGCAAITGYDGVVKLLLERLNVDPNHQCMNGLTPLGWAAGHGHEGVVKLLLEREDVDPNLPDKSGNVLKYSRRFHIINTTTTLDVWTGRVCVWIGLQIMVLEVMVVLWEG